MKLEQTYIEPAYQILVKLMCENGNEHGSRIIEDKTKLLDWWTDCGGNGDMETLEACIQHLSETPFDITNSLGSYTLPFIDKYEDKDGFFCISFHQKFLQAFVIKIIDMSKGNNNIS